MLNVLDSVIAFNKSPNENLSTFNHATLNRMNKKYETAEQQCYR